MKQSKTKKRLGLKALSADEAKLLPADLRNIYETYVDWFGGSPMTLLELESESTVCLVCEDFFILWYPIGGHAFMHVNEQGHAPTIAGVAYECRDSLTDVETDGVRYRIRMEGDVMRITPSRLFADYVRCDAQRIQMLVAGVGSSRPAVEGEPGAERPRETSTSIASEGGQTR